MEFLEVISLNWPAAICLIIGLILVIIEMFVPGFGLPGMLGLAFLLGGVLLAADSVLEALVISLILIVILGIVLTIALVSASRGRLSKTPLVLSSATQKEDGFSSVEDMGYFIGREGVATSVLRPAGMAAFDGVKLDVVSEAAFVPAGTQVRVIAVEGRRILVRPIGETFSETKT